METEPTSPTTFSHGSSATQVADMVSNIGAVDFIHQFDSSLNGHVYCRVCAVDRVVLDHCTCCSLPFVVVGLRTPDLQICGVYDGNVSDAGAG